ncbi:MAG: phosphate transport system regulatory protein PhoU [Spirochaetes bacterium GWF1_51_8]|nr:MAG: phosphate transport system regulatory protein PhoU [Spirochaetes bacterium GWF1_51_8]
MTEKIGTIKERAVKFATLVESMIEDAVEGIENKDQSALETVIRKKEPLANSMEIEIDELCIKHLALIRPEAKDLRITMMVAKMSNDLERIGDHAVNIAKSGVFLLDKPFMNSLNEIPKMAALVGGMIKHTIDAFVREDAGLAEKVLKDDDGIDDFRDRMMNELIVKIKESPDKTDLVIHLMNIVRNLERVGDLATNIAENVIYIIKGKVIKIHTGDDTDIKNAI